MASENLDPQWELVTRLVDEILRLRTEHRLLEEEVRDLRLAIAGFRATQPLDSDVFDEPSGNVYKFRPARRR